MLHCGSYILGHIRFFFLQKSQVFLIYFFVCVGLLRKCGFENYVIMSSHVQQYIAKNKGLGEFCICNEVNVYWLTRWRRKLEEIRPCPFIGQ